MPRSRTRDLVVRSDTGFEDAVSSQPFVFVIGPEKKIFYLHREAFAQLSPAFDAMANGAMREAHEGRVEWPDLDVSTFVRFAEFVYTGDYSEAAPEILAPVMPETVDLTNQLDDDDDANLSGCMSSESAEGEFSEESMDEDEVSDDDDDDDDGHDEDGQAISYDMASVDDDGSQVSLLSDTATNTGWPASVTEPEPEFYDAFTEPIPTRLPYSIESYAAAVKMHFDKVVGTESHGPFQHNKRRRLSEEGLYALPANVAPRFAAMQRFYKLRIRKPAFFKRSVPRWKPSGNTQPNEGFEGVFLSHARLYFFADKYCIDRLRDLTLHRLHIRLMGFQIFPQRVADLLALVEEIFINTVEEDPARKILCAFFGCIVEHLRSNIYFKATLRQIPEFAEGLVDEMSRRLE